MSEQEIRKEILSRVLRGDSKGAKAMAAKLIRIMTK